MSRRLEQGVRAARDVRRAARFRAWVEHLRLDLRRQGARLEVEGRAWFDAPPVAVVHAGGGGGTTTLRFEGEVDLGRRTVLELDAGRTNLLAIGTGTRFGHDVRVVLRGGVVRLGPGADVRDRVLLKSAGALLVGERVTLTAGASLQCTGRLELGDGVAVAEHVTVIDSEHPHDGSDTHVLAHPVHVAPVSVGANTYLGANVVVLPGARIGRNSVVGANAVVRAGDYPAGHLLAGLPARVVRPLGPR